MTQCANPVCERKARYRETIDTSYMDHTDADSQVIKTCEKHVEPTNNVKKL